jgi:hypothetical protein
MYVNHSFSAPLLVMLPSNFPRQRPNVASIDQSNLFSRAVLAPLIDSSASKGHKRVESPLFRISRLKYDLETVHARRTILR